MVVREIPSPAASGIVLEKYVYHLRVCLIRSGSSRYRVKEGTLFERMKLGGTVV